MYKNKAVVLGTNYYIGLAVVRSLGKEGITVISVDHDGKNPYGKSKYVSEALIGPHYEKEEKEYLEFLINIGREEEYKPVLFPTADPYVEFMDKYFFELKEYFLFPMDKKGLLTDLLDKEKLINYTEKYNVKTPEIILPTEENLLERVAAEIKYPCIVKPPDSASFVEKYRRKAFIVETEEELTKVLERTKKDGFEVFIQRIIPGPESNNYNFDAYMTQDGKVAHYTTEVKIRQWPNNFGASTYAEQKWVAKAAEFSIPFLEALEYKGFVEIEMKEDENTGEIYLIEVNVRYVNFTQLHVDIGFNTPLLTYREMIGEDIGTNAIDYDTGYRWRYLFEDISAMRGYINLGQMTKEEIKKQNNHKPIVASTWSLDDPWPGIKFFFSLIFRQIGKVFSR